ncbi:uncharacterized protein LOC134934579 [Pseudophryne corroboree]|uniref:uncharacterized protein LOC134934579 n=1 Tax=Pseudophryne corroboree TaxID=495146 RepID=UPI0030817502
MPSSSRTEEESNLSNMDNNTFRRPQETLGQAVKEVESTVQVVRNQGVGEAPDLEPHILLLQKYLGQQVAEHFLNPSYDLPISPVHPMLHEKVGLSAKDYWRLLRQHSEARLMKHITNVPRAMMSSSFTQLVPSKCIARIQDFRKTLALMCRASELNQDKAILIMTNSQLPDQDAWQEKGSPMQYLSEGVLQTKESIICIPFKLREPGNPFQLPPLKSTTVAAAKKNYRFLTEETCNKFKGEFSKRCSERREKNHRLDWKYTINPTTCIHLPSVTADKNETSSRSMPGHTGRNLTLEPLTYRALMDYRPSRTEPGKVQPITTTINEPFK